ncbi:MAG: hypothetical protein R8J94_10890 [Acidimicrobiia bacterium]|nr:hypothetical protein [Acidimicrobiia bacterium]
MPLFSRRIIGVFVVGALTFAACAAREGDDIGSAIFNGTTPDGIQVEPPITTLPIPEIDAIRVPLDFFSVQGAVDAAQPGDLILIDPGVYTEEVIIDVPDVVIRGRDRNTVFIDGLHSATTGLTVLADGVAVENLTVRNYLGDGIVVDGTGRSVPINRFRAFHVTTSNTGQNGISLRNTTNAEVRQGWLSGHASAGIEVSECTACATLITTTLAEFSARGFSVVGANGGVSIFSSTSRNNRTGIAVEDGPTQPSTDVVLAANLVLNNGFTTTPSADPAWDTSFGTGVHIGGTLGTQLAANRITGNTRAGVVLSQNIAGTSGDPIAAVVERNVVVDHAEGDIVLALLDGIIDPGLCVRDNEAAVINPAGASSSAACGETSTAPIRFEWTGQPRTTIPYPNGPVPPGIDGMTEADVAPPIPAGPVVAPDISSAAVPAA